LAQPILPRRGAHAANIDGRCVERRADLQTFEVIRLGDRPLVVGRLANAVAMPREENEVLGFQGLSKALADRTVERSPRIRQA
jgi:hypothetical protein